jgi:O-antigen/teichoic acid export membrane protein
MQNPIKQLAGQTAVYGLGTMVPRFLNYALLTPFYTRIFQLGEYGIVTELYAYVVVLLVILTYGMETGYFRFSVNERKKEVVYSTTLISLLVTSSLFILLVILFNQQIANLLKYSENKEYILIFALIVGIDAFSAIPFAKLRRENRGMKFALIKLINVFVIIVLVFFFLLIAPRQIAKNPQSWIANVYSPHVGVGYVFIANLAGSVISLILLLPEMLGIKLVFKKELFVKMLKYSFPLLIAGLAGTLNEALDKIVLKHLLPENVDALAQLGVYGASFKIAVVLGLFIQMFRYAAEPFFFAHAGKENAKALYAEVMKYFILSGLLIFLGISLYIEIVKHFVGPEFWAGLGIVPIVLLGYLFYGVFVNLSVWYKINDLTKYGALLTAAGAVVTISVNVLFVPKYGYHASAWGHMLCYLTMITISYLLGRRHYKINYPYRKILFYGLLAAGLFVADKLILPGNMVLELGINTIFFLVFCVIVWVREDIKELFFVGKRQ